MHSISLLIHLIYSLQQLPLQNNVSYSPIGVVIAQLVLRSQRSSGFPLKTKGARCGVERCIVAIGLSQ